MLIPLNASPPMSIPFRLPRDRLLKDLQTAQHRLHLLSIVHCLDLSEKTKVPFQTAVEDVPELNSSLSTLLSCICPVHSLFALWENAHET